jgi:hypothetical protein
MRSRIITPKTPLDPRSRAVVIQASRSLDELAIMSSIVSSSESDEVAVVVLTFEESSVI